MPQPPRNRDLPGSVAPAPRVGGRLPRAALAAALLLGALLPGAAGCRDRQRPLLPGDLSRDEAAYLGRVLVLERVRAAVLAAPDRGVALGDSLAAAWGDSAWPETLALAPTDPARAERVHELLLRLLASEHDSLLVHGGLRPLDAPWPSPADSVSGGGFPAASRVRAGD